ncbi:MAG: DUF1565 domain-containing protein [candidate division Zixibacteria bacterium]|nr:DUF1565 domain-containing protein [candidate division Zixibacteria bacterium]
MDHSDSTTISGSTITNNRLHGILLSGSSENDISGNVVTENNDVGVYLKGSSNNNAVSQNTISYNSWGLDVDRSDDNVISGNAVIHNHEYGLMLYYSNNNSIYHNDVINKAWNATDKWYSTNNWDHGYPSGGNYWGDYTGSDNFSGPEQNMPGSDGIGDTPYDNIPGGNNQDNYPLMTAVLGLYADPRGPYTGNVGEVIQFTGSAHGGVPYYDWHWDFGDGNASNQQNPTHSYDSPGFYIVVLTVVDSDDSVASGYVTVRVFHPSQSYVWVDDDFDESTPGWGHDHFDNIQDGVDISGHGGTVYVYSGIYQENVVVDKTINLIGQNNETTMIDACGDGNCILLTADSVNISGFTVRNSAGPDGIAGIKIGSNHNVVTQNVAEQNAYYGIAIFEEFYPEQRNENTISHNLVSDNGWAGILVSGFGGLLACDNVVSNNTVINNGISGVELEGDINTTISGNLIANNRHGIASTEPGSRGTTISGNTICSNQYGISNDPWSAFSEATISNNNITGNSSYGISIKSWNNLISGNLVTNNGGTGIALYGGGPVNVNEIRDNIIRNNGDGGISLDYIRDSQVFGNYIAENRCGMSLNGATYDNLLHENTIVDSYEYGIYIAYAYDNSICHNDFINNNQNSYNEDIANVNLWDDGYPSGGNYWHDYTGPDNFSGPEQDIPGSDGIGDVPYNITGGGQDRYPLMSRWTPSRGDANGDGQINVGDALYMLNYLFRHGPSPVSFEAGDANCDYDHGALDVVFLLNYLFRGGPPPGCS